MLSFFEKIFHEIPERIERLSGGDINEVYLVQISDGMRVIKVNEAHKFPQMLATEAKGLALLRESGAIKVPLVYENGNADDKQFLVLEKIQTGNATPKTWNEFGIRLANLHQKTNPRFGLDHSNYIGSLVQQNALKIKWTDFLITQRLQPMVELAVNQGDVNYIEAKIFDSFYKKLDDLIPQEKPALLHGDLWSGNYLIGPHGEPVLIDPSVYYGHREMDLAMMYLFGGFPPALFDAYNAHFPLEKNWRNRISLHQVYPLLVHVNLFGRSYWDRVKTIVDGVA